MHRKTLNGKTCEKSLPSSGKELFKAFTRRHFPRLRLKYPYLPKSQVRCKVKTLWNKLNKKNEGNDFRDTFNEEKSYGSAGIQNFQLPTVFTTKCHDFEGFGGYLLIILLHYLPDM